jgi:hypothetical protein
MKPMKFLTDIFTALARIAASLNKTADLTDRFNADFEARLDMREAPRLIEAAGEPETPRVGNGRAAKRTT